MKVIHWEVLYPKIIVGEGIGEKDFRCNLLRNGKTKKILGLRFKWVLHIKSTSGQQLINYLAEDDYRLWSKPDANTLISLLRTSYIEFCKEFDKRAEAMNVDYKIPVLNDSDCHIACQEILALLP